MTADNKDGLLRSVIQQNAESVRAARLRAEQQAEATLREQANLLNLTHDAIFVRDMNGTVKYWNRGAEELYGWPAEQAVGRVIQELLKTIFLVPLEQIEEEVTRAGRWEGELVQTKKDGSQVVVASRWSLQRDERSAPVAILVINNDITKRKRAEDAARRSEKELRDVVNALPAFVWSTLPDGAVDFVNERWLEFTGLPPQQALGWNWEAVVHPDDRSRVVADWRAALKNGRSTEGEIRVRRADGEFRWWFFRNVPLHDETGNIAKWYGTGVDIEDRKRAEALLAVEKRILEMVAKGDSLADILDSLCRLVEEQASSVLASILLLDGDRLRHGSAPSLPKAYIDAIDGAVIGPSAGSCGTAAYRGEPVIVEDIATDPLWASYRDLALPHSLRACWSTPVFSSQGKVIATFAMYYRQSRRPTQRDQEVIDQITHLAGIAIQQKLAHEKLQRSEAYLVEAEKLTHTGSWVWDARTQKVLYCSEEMFRIFGLDPRESLPTRKNFRQRVHPEDRDWVDKRFERSLREKVDSFDEYRVLLPDGTVRHINSSGHLVLDADGELIEVVGTAVDVTERKRAELERRRLASLVEQAADLMAIADLSGGTPIYLNKAGLKMVGFDSWEEARTRRGIHYIFPEDRQFVNEVLWPTVLEKGSWSGEMRFRHFKTGDPIPVLYSAFRIDDPETGQAVNVGNVCRDITERKRAEQALRTSEERWRSVFETSTVGVATSDITRRYTAANRALQEMVGYTQEEMLQLDPLDLIHEDDRPCTAELVAEMLSGRRQSYQIEARYRRKDGEIIWASVYCSHVPGTDMVSDFYQSIIVDITERKRAEAEARKSEQRYREVQMELAHANRVATMGQLTASIAHEVNQPITGTVTSAQAALRWLDRRPPDLEEVRQALARIVKDADRAADVIGRIRDLIRKAPPREDRLQINEAIREVIELTHGEAVKYGVTVRTELADGLPLFRGDRVELQQVILNLIVNAVDAMSGISEQRELLISTEAASDGVLVAVRDSGPGFAPGALEHLFDTFYTTKPSGLGLGLSISRSIIEAYGGRLWASGNVPRGAMFQFTLPVQAGSAS
jgi:PAS domain S-box-containing protein